MTWNTFEEASQFSGVPTGSHSNVVQLEHTPCVCVYTKNKIKLWGGKPHDNWWPAMTKGAREMERMQGLWGNLFSSCIPCTILSDGALRETLSCTLFYKGMAAQPGGQWYSTSQENSSFLTSVWGLLALCKLNLPLVLHLENEDNEPDILTLIKGFAVGGQHVQSKSFLVPL